MTLPVEADAQSEKAWVSGIDAPLIPSNDIQSSDTTEYSLVTIVRSTSAAEKHSFVGKYIITLCLNAARHRKRLFIDHSFYVRISYYCNNVEYT